MDAKGRVNLYPLRLKEILRDYAFGDRWIARAFAKSDLPANHRLGETWEVCDRPGESSLIVNGPLKGQTLRQAIDQYGAALLGRDIAERFGRRFPLLVKFLDATHPLGEQVHADDELTRRRKVDDYSGKTEAWYMLRTAPGARVFCGSRPGLTRAGLLAAVMGNDSRSCMVDYPARPGDAFLLYAGTMHYSPGGLLFYEIMQNSDVYSALGRFKPSLPEAQKERLAREAVEAVHLEEGFDCRTRPVTIPWGGNRCTFVLACQHFALERLDLVGPCALALDGRRFFVLTAIAGQARVVCPGGEELLLPGQTCLLPASLGEVGIEPQGQSALLKGYVPDLMADVIVPLRAGGADDGEIRALGGKTQLNPFNRLL
jgi:mannose-6-phosphate isomerase